jgi:hypothetical protein
MTSTSWKAGVSGDWFTAANWTHGVPTSAVDVSISAFGIYTVSLSGAGVANSLTLDSTGATFSESSGGTLALAGQFDVDAGTAILNGNNTFGSGLVLSGANSVAAVNGTNTITNGTIIENFARLDLGSAGGLGISGVQIFQAELRATATETIENALTLSRAATIAAASGKILTLNNGNWSITQATTDIQFGSASDTGTVVWHTASPGTNDGHDILVAGGTLKGGDSNFGAFFVNEVETTVNAGAKLDLGGASATINDLQGGGIVTSSAGAPTLTLTTDLRDQSGNLFETVNAVLAGSLSLDLANSGSGYAFTANNVYSGTTTVESSVNLTIGNGGTSGTLGHGTVDLNNGGLDFDRSDTLTVANTIVGNGAVDYLDGTYIVRGSNTYSGFTQILGSALVEATNAFVFGSGLLSISGNSEVLATANLALANALSFGIQTADTATIAVTHGHILTLSTSAGWEILDGAEIKIGDGTHDGTVLWKAGSNGTFDGPDATVEIRSGTLKDGDGTLVNFLQGMASVTIDAGTTLSFTDTASIPNLQGDGTILVGGSHILSIRGGDFAGTIDARTLTTFGSVVLTGDSPEVTSITVGGNGVLVLGDGGTTGSAGMGPVLIGATSTLIIDHSNNVALTGEITSGPSSTLELLGTGTTTIDRVNNNFFGVVDIVAGELSIDRASAIGNGPLTFEGGELLSTGNVALANGVMYIMGDVTFAAAAGRMLTLEATSWSFDADSLAFGDGTNTGKIVWHTPGSGTGVAPGDHFTVDVATGATLVLADGNISQLLVPADSTTIETGATLNIGAQGTAIGNLLGAGTILGSGGAQLQVTDGDFAGLIKGAMSVSVSGDFEVTGRNTFTGDYNLETGGTLTLGNIATEDVFFFGNSTLAFTLGHAYGGTVFNFDLNIGTLDFGGISFGSATEHFNNGVLTISDGTHSMHVALDGNFSDASFALSDDHHGGTAVNFTGTFADGDYFGNG